MLALAVDRGERRRDPVRNACRIEPRVIAVGGAHPALTKRDDGYDIPVREYGTAGVTETGFVVVVLSAQLQEPRCRHVLTERFECADLARPAVRAERRIRVAEPLNSISDNVEELRLQVERVNVVQWRNRRRSDACRRSHEFDEPDVRRALPVQPALRVSV